MSQLGKPSTAHYYNSSGACIHCGMYRVNVEAMSHNCTAKREAQQDELDRLQGSEAEANDHGE